MRKISEMKNIPYFVPVVYDFQAILQRYTNLNTGFIS